MIDAAAGGAIGNKTLEDARQLFDGMTMNI